MMMLQWRVRGTLMPISSVPLFSLTLCRGRTWFSGSNASIERDRTDWWTPANWSGSWRSSAEETSGCRTRRANSPRARGRTNDHGKTSLEKARERKPEEDGPDLIAKVAGHYGAGVLQRIKRSGNLHWPASQNEWRRQSIRQSRNAYTNARCWDSRWSIILMSI